MSFKRWENNFVVDNLYMAISLLPTLFTAKLYTKLTKKKLTIFFSFFAGSLVFLILLFLLLKCCCFSLQDQNLLIVMLFGCWNGSAKSLKKNKKNPDNLRKHICVKHSLGWHFPENCMTVGYGSSTPCVREWLHQSVFAGSTKISLVGTVRKWGLKSSLPGWWRIWFWRSCYKKLPNMTEWTFSLSFQTSCLSYLANPRRRFFSVRSALLWTGVGIYNRRARGKPQCSIPSSRHCNIDRIWIRSSASLQSKK